MTRSTTALTYCSLLTLACAAPLFVFACAGDKPSPAEPEADDAEARAQLFNEDGELVADATLTSLENGVAIDFEIYALPPGIHGFHIHETGDCDAPDFKSAGGHFNPLGADHGFGDDPAAHLGDLPNVPVGTDGASEGRLLVEGVSLTPEGERSLLAGDGTALVVHAGADDYETDPAGDAGPRIACGVIERPNMTAR